LTPKLSFSILDNWNPEVVGSIGSFFGGGTPNTANAEYWLGDIPWISSSDLTEGDIHNISIRRFITNEAIKNSAAKLIPANSIVIVTRVGVGKLAITKISLCTSQDFSSISINKSHDVEFVAYALKNKITERLKYLQGTSIKGITTAEIKDTIINLPSLAEQQKISTFLNLYYRKVELQKAKVESLKKLRLSTLHDFTKTNSTNLVKLKTVCKSKQKGSIPQITEAGTPLLHNEYLENGTSPLFVNSKPDTDRNHVLILWDGSQAGKTYTGHQGFLGSTLTRLEVKDSVSAKYVYYILSMNESLIQHVWREGSGVPHVAKDFIEHFKIPLPSFETQRRLVTTLESIDTKITLEKQKLALLEKYKQGLLQKMFV